MKLGKKKKMLLNGWLLLNIYFYINSIRSKRKMFEKNFL